MRLLGELLADNQFDQIRPGDAGQRLVGDGLQFVGELIFDLLGANTTSMFGVAQTMVAPSPDWFVGVRGVPLIEKGKWVERKSIPLYPYDAGTDSGRTFRSPNAVTGPRENISRIAEPPLGNRRGFVQRMGTFIFEREDF